MLHHLTRIRNRKTGRCSSWDTSGRNNDAWRIQPGETRVLADVCGPAQITHLWMTQLAGYRECLLRITFDDAASPQVNVPLGDFFGLGNSIVNSYQSALFTASANADYRMNAACALNCYVPMPFRHRALVELVNEGQHTQVQYFYVDYESLTPEDVAEPFGYFHAEFRRTNPFGGWGHEIKVNTPEADIVNKQKQAWDNNYVVLKTKGCGHYIGCNLSVTNFQGTWWGEGDDMIWVDGYKWPPDIHGTGSEDYFGQAWGMQSNAFWRNGSSVYEDHNQCGASSWAPHLGGYQTSYVFHLENPVRFQKEVKVTIEHGHGNHLQNEMSSVAYWYAIKPARVMSPPPVAKRMPVLCDNQGQWLIDKSSQHPGRKIKLNAEMQRMKKRWEKPK